VLLASNEDAIIKRLAYCVKRATAAQPEDRYQSVDALLSDLDLLLEQPHLLLRSEAVALGLMRDLLSTQDFSVASRCVELLQAELDCIRWPGVSADFGPGGVS
jgi:hypothetical protein